MSQKGVSALLILLDAEQERYVGSNFEFHGHLIIARTLTVLKN